MDRRLSGERVNEKIEDANPVQDVNALMTEAKKEVPIHDSVEDFVNSQVKEEIAKITETNFTCTICSELFIEPMTADCGHTFCSFCINKWRRTKNSCPTCRNKVITLGKTVVIESFLDSMVKKMSQEDQEKRMEVIKERSLRKEMVISKRRNLRNLTTEYEPMTVVSVYPIEASQISTSHNVREVSYYYWDLPVSSSHNTQDSASAHIQPSTYLSRTADDTNSRNEQVSNSSSNRSRFQIDSISRPRILSRFHMRTLRLHSRSDHEGYYETLLSNSSENSNSRNEHAGPVPLHRSRSPLP